MMMGMKLEGGSAMLLKLAVWAGAAVTPEAGAAVLIAETIDPLYYGQYRVF